ncbi:hypothetical protein TNCV_1162821 [Trichonephila clavipes]|nr:hypothetical protein TNCV_1162821 [Trichonephila clavipes]
MNKGSSLERKFHNPSHPHSPVPKVCTVGSNDSGRMNQSVDCHTLALKVRNKNHEIWNQNHNHWSRLGDVDCVRCDTKLCHVSDE